MTNLLQPMSNSEPESGMITPKPLSDVILANMAAVEKAIGGFNKDGKRPLIGKVADVYAHSGDLAFIPTGLLPVDSVLGGGFALRRMYELYGPEGSGKTSLCFKLLAECQKTGRIASIIDAEQAFDAGRAMTIGVDIDQLYLSQPDYGEQAIDIAVALCRSGGVGLVVIDSVAALIPKAEYEGSMEDSTQMAHVAAMMTKAVRMLKGACREGNTCVIFINQLREKPGVVYGNPEYTPGGRAVKFFADARVEIRKQKAIKVGESNIIGHSFRVQAVKNKLAPPMVPSFANLYYDSRGFDELASVIETACMQGLLQKAGAWVSIPLDSVDFPELAGQNIGQGVEAARAYLDDPANLEIRNKLISLCTSNILLRRKEIIERLTQSVRMGQLEPQQESSEPKVTGKKKAKKKNS